ncbi:50S ribosomal protein L3 N(5)-glutamine methyltransferase [Aliiglaciecola sp. 3_MG-2023]|uniref:50S ribosomal protein L3 N(5)-glutamine methyltransferase n=1 Tax=Aliiglaciecola sp. 3_MG-2023 TaxID=3062644 RepID=UPI0026E41569|nr:50S ribosomal protein L3 N(5)-glutamine methyltransferase [Aliiglaciecola sp. 3_MG-2023]MDO6695342.1 50S ribosomal protein L3 N(5)-glutamine methyltransferase [Aliiglaciecola sp. 3_MG-2023]
MTSIDSIDLESTATELISILDVVRWSMSLFNQADLYFGHGTDNAWSEALTLALQVLHLPQNMPEDDSRMLLQSRLTTAEKSQILALVKRRITEKVPVAYLTNQAWFCGLPFYVDERVLVPRSPFAELINQHFSSWLKTEPQHILDLCTGSACIAIALAYEFAEAQIDAVDISDDALQVADINIQEHAMSEQVFPIKSDLMSALQGHKYDLIVSNPPYVDAEDMADLPDEFQHEPELGLAAGEDGLDLVDHILRQAVEHLNPDGWLFVEVGNSEVHMDYKYPDLEIEWVEFEHGGSGVFAINQATLKAYWATHS